jgi:hypothetical protein
MLHGAGIFTPTFAQTKSPSYVVKYTSTMVRIWAGDNNKKPTSDPLRQLLRSMIRGRGLLLGEAQQLPGSL